MRYVVLIVALALAVGLCFALGGFAGAAWVWMLPVFFVWRRSTTRFPTR